MHKLINNIHLQSGQSFTINGIVGSADSWYIANNYNYEGVWLIVCANATDLERLGQEIHFLAPTLKVHIFSDRELLPYDQFSPHADLISDRMSTLYALLQGNCHIVLSYASTTAQKISPTNFLAKYTFNILKKQNFNEQAFKNQMQIAGYTHVNSVMQTGEFCIRGSIVDVFPMGSPLPYRIDLFDDIVDTIKVFNPDSQRSLYEVDNINLLPSKEFAFDKQAKATFLQNFIHKFNNTGLQSIIYENIKQGIAISGIESYLPLFFENCTTASLFDYLPKDSYVVTIGDIQNSLQNLWQDAIEHYNFFATDKHRPLLPPQDLYLKPDEWFSIVKNFARINLKLQLQNVEIQHKKDLSYSYHLPQIFIENRKIEALGKLKEFCQQYHTYAIIICVESLGRQDSMQNLLNKYNLSFALLPNDKTIQYSTLEAGIYLHLSKLNFGFILVAEKIIFITEQELYENYIKKSVKNVSENNTENILKDLSDLALGEAVVHINHGIGRYKGLISIDTGNGLEDFLQLEYANEASLYVPIQHLHLISRYAGSDSEHAPLHKLGSGQWEKARKKASEKIYDTAAELLELYAKRNLRHGYSIKIDQEEYERFAMGFGFNTTPDQELAIQNVLSDLCNAKSMDRLICGDVGFGKTEVAMRAAFAVAMSGKQILILSPTTLLAEQHYHNFTNRFSQWAINIAEFSRFKTAKELKHNIEQLNQGKIDIAIGTHKLLSPQIKAPNLGLIIIDEEHRFGVRQKELIKNIRADVDILALTATPIPRTLGMALEGLREFSVIATAPQKRLSVKTFVRREDKSIIREALLREIKRGGQVYFVHNDIDSIEYRRQQIKEIVPEANIIIAHGRLPERELEKVMKDFYSQKYNVLMCTTIIETGIDVPTANTIILDRADCFGLAQLHQLRGRVGRSHHQAYAYLLIHDFDSISTASKRRLDAIQNLQELGSGFYLAMQDLEIRGAGEILGEKQSGEMQQIGFNLYTEMLNQAVQGLKEGKPVDLMKPNYNSVDISLGASTLLPDNYIYEVHTRLAFYKKLSCAANINQIIEIKEEIIDQFGKLPPASELLIQSHILRVKSQELGIIKISCLNTNCNIQFNADKHRVNPERIIRLLHSRKDLSLIGENSLKLNYKENLESMKRCNLLHDLIDELS